MNEHDFEKLFRLKNLRPHRQQVILLHPADAHHLSENEEITHPIGNQMFTSMFVPQGQAILIEKENNLGVGFEEVKKVMNEAFQSSFIDSVYGVNIPSVGSRFRGNRETTEARRRKMLSQIFDVSNYSSFMEYSDEMMRQISDPEHGLEALFSYQSTTYKKVFSWFTSLSNGLRSRLSS